MKKLTLAALGAAALIAGSAAAAPALAHDDGVRFGIVIGDGPRHHDWERARWQQERWEREREWRRREWRREHWQRHHDWERHRDWDRGHDGW